MTVSQPELDFTAPVRAARPRFKRQRRDPDAVRMDTQRGRVFRAMKNGEWVTLETLSARVLALKEADGVSNPRPDRETALSARIRDFRRVEHAERFGVRAVESEDLGGGLWRYRLILKP